MADTDEFTHLTHPPATALGPVDGADDDEITSDDLEGSDEVDEFIGTGDPTPGD